MRCKNNYATMTIILATYNDISAINKMMINCIITITCLYVSRGTSRSVFIVDFIYLIVSFNYSLCKYINDIR